MQKNDLLRVEITPELKQEARKEADFLRIRWGRKTRAAYGERDLIGSLAHQVVEVKLLELGLSFESQRKKKMPGDDFDIYYEGDAIDVKGTHGELDDYFYNKEFLVFQKQLDDPKINQIDYFVFVMVSTILNEGWIFGAISLSDFMEKSYPVKLKFENRGIRAYQLKPFLSYIFRT
jgi:hypothetical protein